VDNGDLPVYPGYKDIQDLPVILEHPGLKVLLVYEDLQDLPVILEYRDYRA